MKQQLQQFIQYIKVNDLAGLLLFYKSCSEVQNIEQLKFLFQQAQSSAEAFELYQSLTTKLIALKGLPQSLIAKINNSDTLAFFTPALQMNSHFSRTDEHGNNVLHYCNTSLFTLSILLSV